MFCISETKKEASRFCCAYSCRNKPVKKKGGLCHKHYARKRRKIDPIATRFNDFKGNAKKRGKPFFITLEQFRKFCSASGYLIIKGRRGFNATIDRIDNSKGYSIDNIQLLTLRQNSSKGCIDIEDLPF